MSGSEPRGTVRLDSTILLLAIAGGGVDAVLIMSFNVLTGAQTGNTVLLGAALALGRFAAAFGSLISVIAYVIGVIAGEFIIVKYRRARPSAVGMILIAEIILLSCLLALWHLAGAQPGPAMIPVLVACAASAMGMQAAAMLRLGKVPTTTYITGTLTTFATNLVRWLDSAESTPQQTGKPRGLTILDKLAARDGLWLYGLTWFAYVTATVLTGLLFLRVRELALMLPIFSIVLAFAASRHANQWDNLMIEALP
jgi:uncharacterized membrane protein YoaK (UPF0700 family)